MNQNEKLNVLTARLAGLPSALVAFSGGIDSRFLVAACMRAGLEFQAVHFTGAHVTQAESRAAVDWLVEAKVPFHVLEVDLLAVEGVRYNGPDRCYHCKSALFIKARELADKLGLAVILEGSQTSDLKAYRPGRKALEELGVLSPLAEAGLSKPEIRALAAELGVPRPEQPGRPCLLTRLEYGVQADAATLKRLSRAEEDLMRLGLKDFRLRIASGASPMSRYFVLQINATERPAFEAIRAKAFESLFRDQVHPVELVFSETVTGYFDAKLGLA